MSLNVCIISHWFETKRGGRVVGLSPGKDQQGWVAKWVGVVAGEGGVKDPSGDKTEESLVEFKFTGTKL